MTFQRNFSSYKAPGKDTPRAKAQAVTFLVSARSIDHLTVDGFAHRYHLSAKTAEYLLWREKQRRGLNGQ